jgi:hypothetical protein
VGQELLKVCMMWLIASVFGELAAGDLVLTAEGSIQPRGFDKGVTASLKAVLRAAGRCGSRARSLRVSDLGQARLNVSFVVG